ncbi:MAG: hypothetical protein QM582_15855 [Micropruina sp.]|uniref:hypothetical protein n=1 Tax=Micropruina sp. TaxID=2737536 RepID=UPI0039E35937
MDDEFRADLRKAVPDPPDTASWAGEARRRHGRRTRRAMTGGVAVLVLAVLGSFLWPSLNGAGRVAVPAVSPTTVPPAPAENPDCADVPVPATKLAPRGDSAVLRASLCPRTDGPTFTTPSDALDEGATALFDTVAALPAEQRRDPDCSAAGDRRYLVVFTLADGSRRVLEAAAGNACGVTPSSANGRRWSGLLSALEKAWAAQRALRSAPAVTPTCVPYDRPGLFRFEVSQALAGVLCVADRAGAFTGSPARLSPEVLSLLRSDIAANSSRASNIDSMRDGPVLTLAGPWGDPLVFWRVEGNQWFAFMPDGDRGEDQLFWQPGAKATDTVEELLASVTPRPSRTPTAVPSGGLVPSQCQGLVPSTSPTEVPARADRLRLCPTARSAASIITPLDAVTGDDTATVLSTLTGLPKASTKQGCTEEFGPDYLLVAEVDGRPPVVMVLQLYGCRLVGIADAAHTGANDVLTAFKQQLTRQREQIDRPAATRTGPLCGTREDVPTSVMPMAVTEATGARLCVYRTGDEPIRDVALSSTDVRAIVADFPGRNGPFRPMPCPYQPNSRNRIALTSFYGDVLVLSQSCGGVFVFSMGSDYRQWKPSDAVAKRLEKLIAG